ncbi:MAG: hypothetical protein AB7L18_10570, partial [Hyphomicrobiaceae bacterium]
AAVLWPFMKPMLAGSLPVGLLVGVFIYYMMRATTRATQARRRGMLEARPVATLAMPGSPIEEPLAVHAEHTTLNSVQPRGA